MKMKLIKYKKLRQEIITKLSEYLIKKWYIYACWLGWSDANNESDEYTFSFNEIDK